MQLMHILKTLASGTLILVSLLWLAIQQILLPNNFVKQLFVSQEQNGDVDFLQLKRDWCRIRSKRITWREMLEPCQEKALFLSDPRFGTNPSLSHVSHIVVKPAGEHTRVRINTYTGHGVSKSFGGDSFRVMFRGPDTVAAAVFDLQNGSYDALALLTTPGLYNIDVILDYTQCNGFKDPPIEWYVKAHCANKNNKTLVPPHISAQSTNYINTFVSPGLTINIAPPRYDLKELEKISVNTDCGFACKLVWDGHGVWSRDNKKWQQYTKLPQDTRSIKRIPKNTNQQRKTLWIYGDSISYYFYSRLKKTTLCQQILKTCENTYNWIYPKVLYEMRHFCEDMDVNTDKVRSYFQDVINNKMMDENSTLIFNLGAHFVKNSSFRKYREIIDTFIEELRRYKGTAIWKSTTAIHYQNIEVMGAFRRYLTSQRVQLFNAYANAAMCNAGKTLLDMYPMTSSYPDGTKDGVHYHANASLPIENYLQEYLS